MTRAQLSVTVAIALSFNQAVGAQAPQPPLVVRGELRAAIRSAAERRDKNLETVRRFLRDPRVEREAGRLMDLPRVSRALTALDDPTLERLATESERAREDLRGEGVGKAFIISVLVVVVVLVIVSAALPESS